MESVNFVGTRLDIVIIVAYFVVIFLFGTYFTRFTQSTSDFFVGGQRFSWWLVAMSLLATTVGSYSFVKYSAVGFNYGFASSTSYMNDWIQAPLLLFTWIPLIYFSKVSSVPEYFQRRFDAKSRIVSTLISLVYMVGYIGITLYTMGIAMNAMMGTDIFWSAVVCAVVTGVYVMGGGQAAVIMTDFIQGVLLFFAGLAILFLGLNYLGGWEKFWELLPLEWRLPLPKFNSPPDYHFVGVFWQDAMANNVFFTLANQGFILRYLSLKSMREANKTFFFNMVLLMPVGAISVASAGWIGRAMVNAGYLPVDTVANKIFVTVSKTLCGPGMFGLLMAGFASAMMSTFSALVNAVSVIWVNDIYRPYLAKNRADRHYLNTARLASIVATIIGISLIPVFATYKSVYLAHGTFIALVTPPMVMAILFGALWRRYTPAAAFWTMVGGTVAMILSTVYPQLVAPFSHGEDPSGGYRYLRACYGMVVSGAIGLIVTGFTKPKPFAELEGLVIGTVQKAREKFKGSPLNEEEGETVVGHLEEISGEKRLSLHPDDMARLKARVGDFLYLSDARWWLGGLRSVHVTLGEPHTKSPGLFQLSPDLIQQGRLFSRRRHRIEKIF